jgi:hypothetical protein
LTAAQRRALPASAFLVPSKRPGPGSFPVPDTAHRRAVPGLAGRSAAAGNISSGKAKRLGQEAKGLAGALRDEAGR